MKSRIKNSYLILLLFIVLLAYPVRVSLQYTELTWFSNKTTITQYNTIISSNVHPENAPDKKMLITSYGFPSGGLLNGQPGLEEFSLKVEVGKKLPFQAITDQTSVDLGVLNAMNISLAIFITEKGNIVKTFYDYFYFDENSTELDQYVDYTWYPRASSQFLPFDQKLTANYSYFWGKTGFTDL